MFLAVMRPLASWLRVYFKVSPRTNEAVGSADLSGWQFGYFGGHSIGGGSMINVYALVPVWPVLSVLVMVKELLISLTDVPLIIEPVNVKPAGKAPEVIA